MREWVPIVSTRKQDWRCLESQVRIIANTMTDPGPKRAMLSIALAYQLLADRAELRNAHKNDLDYPDISSEPPQTLAISWFVNLSRAM